MTNKQAVIDAAQEVASLKPSEAKLTTLNLEKVNKVSFQICCSSVGLQFKITNIAKMSQFYHLYLDKAKEFCREFTADK